MTKMILVLLVSTKYILSLSMYTHDIEVERGPWKGQGLKGGKKEGKDYV